MAKQKPTLTVPTMLLEAARFAKIESKFDEPSLYGINDGKAVGTYVEHKFVACLMDKFAMEGGNSALGIDLPSIEVDIKVTSVRQPQSSCPFKSARQKIYGLGYGLVVFVYAKTDDEKRRTSRLDMRHVIFIEKGKTADYQTTRGLRELLERDANTDDIVAFIQERNLPVDEIQAQNLAEELLQKKPAQGYLTISNALQWRLQYQRVIEQAGKVAGVQKVR